jgi:ATP-dependent Lhr-like helicase
LGSLPIEHPVTEGSFLIFAGKRWAVVSVDDKRKVIDLKPTKAGRPPMFGGSGAKVHKRVREAMRDVYSGIDHYPFLDASAKELLLEGRHFFSTMSLNEQSVVCSGQNVLLFCWAGDRSIHTLMLQLMQLGFKISKDNFVLTIENVGQDRVFDCLQSLAETGPCDPNLLAASVRNKALEKYDHFLTEELLTIDYASKYLDSQGAFELVNTIIGS